MTLRRVKLHRLGFTWVVYKPNRLTFTLGYNPVSLVFSLVIMIRPFRHNCKISEHTSTSSKHSLARGLGSVGPTPK